MTKDSTEENLYQVSHTVLKWKELIMLIPTITGINYVFTISIITSYNFDFSSVLHKYSHFLFLPFSQSHISMSSDNKVVILRVSGKTTSAYKSIFQIIRIKNRINFFNKSTVDVFAILWISTVFLIAQRFRRYSNHRHKKYRWGMLCRGNGPR